MQHQHPAHVAAPWRTMWQENVDTTPTAARPHMRGPGPAGVKNVKQLSLSAVKGRVRTQRCHRGAEWWGDHVCLPHGAHQARSCCWRCGNRFTDVLRPSRAVIPNCLDWRYLTRNQSLVVTPWLPVCFGLWAASRVVFPSQIISCKQLVRVWRGEKNTIFHCTVYHLMTLRFIFLRPLEYENLC